MKDSKEHEEVFRREPLPTRLRKMATEISPISEISRDPASSETVEALLDDARWLMEWTAADLDPRSGEELANLQLTLTIWLSIWREEQVTRRLRALLYHEMRCWSDRVLDFADRIAPQDESAVG